MKRIFKLILGLPNLPFIIIISIHILVRINKESSFIELEMKEEDELLTDDILNYVKVIYPKGLRLLIAFMFWSTLIIHFI